MATYSDGPEHESSAKRIKLGPDVPGPEAGRSTIEYPVFSVTFGSRSAPSEVGLPDCDSGYEASTMGSIPTPPHQPAGLEGLTQPPNHLDLSQDSIDADDDNVSTVSELSGLSDLSGQDWKPMAGSMTWIQKQMQNGMDPRSVLVDLGVEMHQIPQYVDNVTLWKLIVNMLAEPPRRHKLRHVNTLDDIVRLLKGAQKIIVLTGAGVSVSCGIPDFRSRDGIYSRLAIDFPDLPDPQAMFDISYFNQDPRPFFKFARDIYPGKFQPSPCHRFIRLLEKHGKLLRNYTQNIDTLEKEADIGRVIECHGSFATATCTKCGRRVTANDIRETVLAQYVPVCEVCRPDVGPAVSIGSLNDREPGALRDLVAAGIMKPDIVFFGEGLPDSFHEAMSGDKNDCDLLVVIGSSLKVRPVALIPSSLPAHVPQILINREPLPHCHFDVELLGDCDVIINHLCHMLGANWEESIYEPEMLKETLHLLPWKTDTTPTKKVKTPKKSDPDEDLCRCGGSPREHSGGCECLQKRPSEPEDPAAIKGRHMSVDSARDSGIGDNSNFTDADADRDSYLNGYELELSSNGFKDNRQSDASKAGQSDGSTFTGVLEEKTQQDRSLEDLQGYWQPKQKRTITERLPKNSYYLIHPSRYIFPGAELYYDPDEKCSYLDSTSSESSESESDETEAPDP